MTNGITSDNNIAVLIYYNNVSGGVASNLFGYAYDESGSNNNGPVTAIKQLPTTEQWKNVSLVNTIRAITNENGENTTSAGNLPTSFSYEGYAARLLTTQEVATGCGTTIGTYVIGDLSKSCKYLMENTRYSLNNYLATYGVLLESPVSNSTSFWTVYSFDRSVQTCFSTGGSGDPIPGGNGVRPAIEVAKSNISY